VLVEPDHVAYREVTLADVEEIVDATVKGERVERLLVVPPPSPGAVGGG
jgi:(2Fe-2S) ferredoxin